jgi:CheY-like chemotaxis protein
MDPQKTILIIDDEADFREIFSIKLAAAGYHIETASDGEEGIKKVRELRPDLVLLDVKMPGIGGEEVVSRLRGDPATSFTKIIFTTNFGDPNDVGTSEALAKKFGADGFIQKTENIDTLAALVDSYIKRKPSGED